MSSDRTIVIGLGGSNHDGSAVLARGATIEVGVEQERVTRRKHGAAWWWENPVGAAVDYCLSAAGVALGDVEGFVSSDLLPGRVMEAYASYPMALYPHHACHAASSCVMLPPSTRAAILVYDGMGSITGGLNGPIPHNVRETFSFFLFDGTDLHSLGRTTGKSTREHDDFPSGCSNSIGKLYDIVTALIGFHEDEPGKTMGLAAHGQPRYAGLIEEFLTLGNDWASCLAFDAGDSALPDMLRGILSRSPDFSTKADLAASIQAVLEKVLLHAASLMSEVDHDVLCVVGGCALNSVANGRLATTLRPGRRLLVPPHAGDAGIGIGALWLDRLIKNGVPPHFTLRGRSLDPWIARPGRLYGVERCRSAARGAYPQLIPDASVAGPRDLAERIAGGQVVGILNGPSEMGPRALGGRSILADPRQALSRERLNREIKHREPFRPLAPMVLEERCEEFFVDVRCTDSFMIRVAEATAKCAKLAPAVVHVDGTARVQTVPPDGDPFLRALLTAFDEITGVPMLLNTSFNRRGEPIVETPEDAVDAFLAMKLDGLYLDGLYFIHPKAMAMS